MAYVTLLSPSSKNGFVLYVAKLMFLSIGRLTVGMSDTPDNFHGYF